jgi:hypothetical protein
VQLLMVVVVIEEECLFVGHSADSANSVPA